MSDIPHTKSYPNAKQEKDSCIVTEKEPSHVSQKQSSDTINHTSSCDKASLVTKHKQYDVHQRQTSGGTHDFPETHGEEGICSWKNENEDSDISMEIPNSSPCIPSQESDPASHVIGDVSRILKDKPTDLHSNQSPDVGVKTSLICDVERTPKKREMVAGKSLAIQSVNGVPSSQSNEQMLTQSPHPVKVLEKLQPRRYPDAGGSSSQHDQVTISSGHSKKLSALPKEEHHPDNLQPRECIRDSNHALLGNEEKDANIKGKSFQRSSLSMGVPVSEHGQDSYAYSKKFEKVEKLQPRRNLDSVVQESCADVGSAPSKAPDKGLDDGYSWRKYGQKLVKGNKFVRSYYKCTYPNCQAKKQLEKSHDGCKSDNKYLGNHHHQKPQQSPQVTNTLQVRTPEMSIASTSKANVVPITTHVSSDQLAELSPQSDVGKSADGLSGVVSCSNNDTNDLEDFPDPKRQKRGIRSVDGDVINRSSSDSRHVVQTLSEIDLVNDGYRWRKYGQKLVKGNQNPRSYYRCSNTACPVKKHVERASHDQKLVITTYEGKHIHDIPTSRTVGQSIARGDDDNMVSPNGESSSKPKDKSPVSLEMAVRVIAN
ncbi:hypothetical protein SASPL_124489 [Salvia splendens]|uniref:WRKY domain-containing protein n=1 Tax=Salvia splendens TaxID=180675 RepID=A0A8X8XSA3_SALSN|nr:hypothetical protein SASPL_124489 [Salvia splendens]